MNIENKKTIITSKKILEETMWQFQRVIYDYKYQIMTGVWLDRNQYERRYSMPFCHLSEDINKDIEYIREYGHKEYSLKEFIDNPHNPPASELPRQIV